MTSLSYTCTCSWPNDNKNDNAIWTNWSVWADTHLTDRFEHISFGRPVSLIHVMWFFGRWHHGFCQLKAVRLLVVAGLEGHRSRIAETVNLQVAHHSSPLQIWATWITGSRSGDHRRWANPSVSYRPSTSTAGAAEASCQRSVRAQQAPARGGGEA